MRVCPESVPFPSFPVAPMATRVPSADTDTEKPERSPSFSPSMSWPSCWIGSAELSRIGCASAGPATHTPTATSPTSTAPTTANNRHEPTTPLPTRTNITTPRKLYPKHIVTERRFPSVNNPPTRTTPTVQEANSALHIALENQGDSLDSTQSVRKFFATNGGKSGSRTMNPTKRNDFEVRCEPVD